MAIYALGDVEPTIDPSAYVHPDATVIGDVTLGPGTTVWPQAVLRGDYGVIRVGARTSVQDGAVLHTTPITPTVVGDDVVIGHLAHLECCTVHDGALVGTGSIVLHRAVIEAGALVGRGRGRAERHGRAGAARWRSVCPPRSVPIRRCRRHPAQRRRVRPQR